MEATMIHIAPKFGVLVFINAMFKKMENWRIQQQSRMGCSAMDGHTMQDIGICGTIGFTEATKRMSEK